jgi:type I restriction enzyme, S subunit
MTPDGWMRTSLDSLLESCVYGISTKLSSDSSGTPILRMANISDHRLDLNELKYADISTFDPEKVLLARGDILFNRTNSIDNVGKVALVDTSRRLGFASYLMRLRPNANATPEWLYYLLSAPAMQRRLRALATNGVSQVNINPSKMRKLLVEVPPLPQQRKIAAILSALDDVVEKTEAVIESLQILKTAMMQELLTRGLPGRHIRFKRTEIGELPEEWDVRPLADIGHVQTGIAKGKATTTHAVPVPYLRVANVQDGYLHLQELKTIEVEPNQIDRYRLSVGDVLFTEGGDADKLGRGCVWSGEIDLCVHQNHVFAVRVDSSRVVPQFLALFGASSTGKAYFVEAAKRTTNLASINSTQLKALPVPVPSIDEQREIVRAIGNCSDRIARERSCTDAVRRTKAALMSVLLTGELLRVTAGKSIA